MKIPRFMRIDNCAVSAIEYAVIFPLIVLAISPVLYKAGQDIWGGTGGVGTKANLSLTRGPYNYPDGPVPQDQFEWQWGWIGGGQSYESRGMTAQNGYLFVNMSAWDPIKNVAGPMRSSPFVAGQWASIYIPETGGTTFVASSIGAIPRATYPTMTVQATYPHVNAGWSCGC